jgi:hypothetical protein
MLSLMLRNGKTTSLTAAALLLWALVISTARAESTAVPKQSAYPQVQDPPSDREKPAMTADEQAKLKKELIDARDRQTSKAGGSAAGSKTKKP